jgi:hypothetical protein
MWCRIWIHPSKYLFFRVFKKVFNVYVFNSTSYKSMQQKINSPTSLHEKIRCLIQNNFKEAIKKIRFTIFNPPSSYFLNITSSFLLFHKIGGKQFLQLLSLWRGNNRTPSMGVWEFTVTSGRIEHYLECFVSLLRIFVCISFVCLFVLWGICLFLFLLFLSFFLYCFVYHLVYLFIWIAFSWSCWKEKLENIFLFLHLSTLLISVISVFYQLQTSVIFS